MLESTGERLLPWDTQYPTAHYEHLQRYYFAAEIAHGKKILDLGSGEGYGSNILSESAAAVVGVDISVDAVTWANQKYRRPNLSFICGSATSIPIKGKGLFDMVVCFELLEHVREQGLVINEVKRLLKPEGVLIISTPNKLVYTDEPDFRNPFHVRELYIDQFKELIEASLPFTAYLGQRFHSTLAMWPMGSAATGASDVVIEKKGEQFVRVENVKKQPMYVIAVASRKPFCPEIQDLASRNSVLTDISDTFIHDLQAAYSVQIGHAEANAKTQLANAEAARARALAAESQLIEANKHLRFQHDKIFRLNSDLDGIYASRSWKLMGALQTFRRHVLSTLLPFKRQLVRDAELLESSGLFSSSWYLEQYPDVKHAGLRPALHYLTNGWLDYRNPHQFFDTRWYLERYRDSVPKRTNPLLYFLRSGVHENHAPHPNFDSWDLSRPFREPMQRYFVQKLARMPNSRFYDDRIPGLSIVILNLNNAYLTFQCLVSLWCHTKGCKYEIIVVDNGSRKADLEVLRSIDGPFRMIEIGCNRFFSEGNNIGAENARGQYVVFLNNDVVATANWLEPLLSAFRTHSDCGAVGPKLIYPDGTLQEAGSFVGTDGTSEQRGRGKSADDAEFNSESEVHYVSAAAVVMKRDIFEKVRGFDFRWEPAYYEDVDLCFKIACLDLKTYYVPSSVVIHFGSSTTVDRTSHGLQLDDIVEINRQKFLNRWHDFLSTGDKKTRQGLIRPNLPRRGPRATKDRKRVALFTPFNIIPGGGERVLLSIAEALRCEYEVSLITPYQYSYLRIETVAEILGIDVRDLRLACLADVSKKNPVDVWIAMGNQIIPVVAGRGKKNIYVLQFPFPMKDPESPASKELWRQYEHIAVYSHYVKSQVSATARQYGLEPRPIHVIYPPTECLVDEQAHIRNPHSIINVGRFFSGGHCKKQDLLIRAFNQIVQQHPRFQLELHLVGSLHPEREHREYYRMCQDLAEGLPVHFHLDASPTELMSLYQSSSMYWHATGLGENLKSEPQKAEHFGISIVESMANGCIPIVYGFGGPTEIVQDKVSGFLFNTTDELIELTNHVLMANNLDWIPKMRSAAKLRAAIFSKDAFADTWRKLVDDKNGLSNAVNEIVVNQFPSAEVRREQQARK